MIRVEDFIAEHHRDKVLCIREINNIMGIAWQHMNALDVLTCYFEFYYLSRSNLPFLNESMACYDNEELPFCVMPVLSFRYAWF